MAEDGKGSTESERRAEFPPASKLEIFSWAMFDFANSTYGTVVATAIYSAYFVNVVAKNLPEQGQATLWLTLTISVAAVFVALTAPIIGTIADATASKKKFLFIATAICVIFTAMLSVTGPGDVALAMLLLFITTSSFGTGEDLVAAFLPEIARRDNMGRISAFGWTIGYIGGLTVLGICLAYVNWARSMHQSAEQYVPVTLLITACIFAMAATPIFVILKERALPEKDLPVSDYVLVGWQRLRETYRQARQYEDLWRFFITLFVYTCGTTTVVTLAAVYATEVMKFTPQDNIMLVLAVNVTAAVGAFLFGFVQDKIGSVKTLTITLVIWAAATSLAFVAASKPVFWVVANLVGLAMGASQSAGRALVGQLSPAGRSGEFFGLWGVVGKLAAAVGPLSFGLITYLTHNNLRIAILSTTAYFIASIFMIQSVNEERGRQAVHRDGA
jgi:UMF1 family MFS transporter